MELQHRGGTFRSHIAGDHLLNGFGLVLAQGDDQNALGLHNGANAHGQCLGGHLLNGVKEAAVVLNGALLKGHHMGPPLEGVAGLVKGNVAVGADTQQLNINTAGSANAHLVLLALGL